MLLLSMTCPAAPTISIATWMGFGPRLTIRQLTPPSASIERLGEVKVVMAWAGPVTARVRSAARHAHLNDLQQAVMETSSEAIYWRARQSVASRRASRASTKAWHRVGGSRPTSRELSRTWPPFSERCARTRSAGGCPEWAGSTDLAILVRASPRVLLLLSVSGGRMGAPIRAFYLSS